MSPAPLPSAPGGGSLVERPPILDPMKIVPEHIRKGFEAEFAERQAAQAARRAVDAAALQARPAAAPEEGIAGLLRPQRPEKPDLPDLESFQISVRRPPSRACEYSRGQL